MGNRTGQTSVEVVADVAKFGGELQSGLQKSLNKVKVDSAPLGKKLADGVDAGVKQAEKSLMRLDSVPVGDKLAKGIADGAQVAADAVKKLDDIPIGDGIVAGADKAETALKGVGEEADKTSAKVKAKARETGDGIGDGVGKGSDKAKTSLKGIGEAGKEAAEQTKEGFDKLETALAGVGLVAGAALGESIAEGLQRTRLNGLLVAQIGASPAEAGRIGKLSGEIYADNFGDSIEQVNGALKAAFQNGLADVNKQTDASVKQVTERLLTVSQVLEEDTTRTANAIQQLLRTGLVKNTEAAMDLLVAATQRGVNKSEDLLDTVNEYSTQFRVLGLSGPQALGLLSQAIQAGARDSDTAADALKEFAIRAVDGSALSASGFKALGLDAKEFTRVIGHGGDIANEALGEVLNRLRAIKDPVARNTAAVALFGTKAEDLGKALFAMNLDTAADEFKNLKGATDAASTAIGDTAGAKVDAFTRQLQGKLQGTLAAIGTSVMENQEAYATLGGVLTGLVATIGLVSAATKIWTTYQTLATVATKAWTFANTSLSLSFLASPIGIVIVAVVALVAAFVVAYKKSDAFKNAVDAALRAVGAAGMWLWNNALKPAFAAIMAGLKAVGAAGVWLWENALKPALTAIGAAAVWLWSAVLVPAFNGIVAAARAVGAAAMWLWENAFSPALNAIGAAAQWLWSNVIQPVWNLIVAATQTLGKIFAWWWSVTAPPIKAVAGLVFWLWRQVFAVAFAAIAAWFKVLGAVAEWLWSAIISPIFKLIGALAMWLYRNVIVPAWAGIRVQMQGLGAIALWLWTNAFSPALKAIGAAVKWLWSNVVQPIFSLIRNHIQTQIRQAVTAAGQVQAFVSRVSAGFTNLVNSIRSRLENAAAIARAFPGKIVSAVGNLGHLLYDAGRNVIQGLINGIGSKLGALRDKAGQAAGVIRNLFPFSPAKEGPLSGGGSPEIAGAKIASMVADGMAKNTPKLVAAARSMAAATMAGGRSGLDFTGQNILRAAIGNTGRGAINPGPGNSGIVFGHGAINVSFHGVVPTEREAFRTGQAVGAGIAQTLTDRNVHNTVRQL